MLTKQHACIIFAVRCTRYRYAKAPQVASRSKFGGSGRCSETLHMKAVPEPDSTGQNTSLRSPFFTPLHFFPYLSISPSASLFHEAGHEAGFARPGPLAIIDLVNEPRHRLYNTQPAWVRIAANLAVEDTCPVPAPNPPRRHIVTSRLLTNALIAPHTHTPARSLAATA